MNSGYKLKVALRVPAISAGICLNSIIVYPILSHLSTPRRIKMDIATIVATTVLVFVVQQGLQWVWCKVFHKRKK